MSNIFQLQSPEQIATDYGGNKQRIATAAQQGLIDPTSAVMAGMYIDRMNNAQAASQSVQPTVAQQVLSPSSPASSAGPTSQAAAPSPGIAGAQFGMQYADGGIVGYAPGGEAMSTRLARRKIMGDMKDEERRQAAIQAMYPEFMQTLVPPEHEPRRSRPNPKSLVKLDLGGPNPGRGGSGQEGPDYLEQAQLAYGDYLENPKQWESGLGGINPERQGRTQDGFDYLGRGATALVDGTVDNAKGAVAGLGTIIDLAGRELAGDPNAPQYVDTDYGLDVQDDPSVLDPMWRGYDKAVDWTSRNIIGGELVEVEDPTVLDPMWRGYDWLVDKTSRLFGDGERPTLPPKTGDTPVREEGSAPVDTTAAPTKGARKEEAPVAMPTETKGGVPTEGDTETPYPIPPAPETDAYSAYLKDEQGRAAKEEDRDFWSHVAQFGFNMAASDSPYAMQAAGEAGKAVMPSMQKTIEARRTRERDTMKELANLEGKSRAEQIAAMENVFKRRTQLDVAQLYRTNLDTAYLDAMRRGDTETMERIEQYNRSKTSAGSSSGYRQQQTMIDVENLALKALEQEANSNLRLNTNPQLKQQRLNELRRMYMEQLGIIPAMGGAAAPSQDPMGFRVAP